MSVTVLFRNRFTGVGDVAGSTLQNAGNPADAYHLWREGVNDMAVHGDLLFYAGFGKRATLSDVLRHNLDAGVRDQVDRLTDAEFNAHDDAALAAMVAANCKAEPIVLKLHDAVGGAEPTKVMVDDFFGGRVSVDGIDVTKAIPFEGDPNLFELQPDQFDLNPPRGTVSGKKLTLGMEVRQSDAEVAVRHIQETLAQVEKCLARQAQAIDAYNAALPGAALPFIQRRRSVLGVASDIASRLSGR